MKKSFLSLSAITALVFLFSCNSGNKAADDKTKKDSVPAPAAQNNSTENDADVLPNLLQIGALFKNAELAYTAGMTTNIKEASGMNTFYDRAINLGLYSADLSYCTVNKQKDEVSKYMKVVKEINDALGLGSIFTSDQIAKRFQDNLNNDDSLSSILGDLQIKMDELLAKNKQNDVRAIIYSGAWTESMYIATKSYAKTKNANAGNHIIEQVTILENILKVLGKYQAADAHTGQLYKEMLGIDDTYKAFDEVKNYDPNKSQSIVLTADHIGQLGAATEKLRSRLVGGNS